MRWINTRYELPPIGVWVFGWSNDKQPITVKVVKKMNDFYSENVGELFCIDECKKITDRDDIEYIDKQGKRININTITHFINIKPPTNV